MDGSIRLTSLLFLAVFSIFGSGCNQLEGDNGAAGATGPAGVSGATGAAGSPGISTGTITGTITDAQGTPLSNVLIATEPSSVTTTSGIDGTYTLTNVPIGIYAISASLTGYNAAALGETSVGATLTVTANFELSLASGALTTLSGRITNTAGAPISGATALVSGTSLAAITDDNGDYMIDKVPSPGPYFIDVTAPTDSTYLDGGTRESFWITSNGNTIDDIMLSSKPPATAKFTGKKFCALCHSDEGDEHEGSAHWRSLAADTSRMIELDFWPVVGGTVDPGVSALNPADPNGPQVAVYWCQNTARTYTMKFGGTADCTVVDGTLVPVSGTYGGEGDGGIDDIPNVGVYKQRYLAMLSDVPSTDGWVYTTGKEKDYLILPVQITQSGDDAPKFGGYHGKDWLRQSRAFSRKCAGCHNTGMEIAWNNDTEGLITSFDYIELNISCERCHGPGSAHSESRGGLANQIINPAYMTAAAERQLCGQCHAADAGNSSKPSGTFGYAWNADHAGDIGGGVYVPGIYDIGDFIGNLTSGGFDAWPDGKHGKAHRQQYSELIASAHVNNPWERLTCANCHNVHSLRQGPSMVEKEGAGGSYVFSGSMQMRNNEICFSCHVTHGPFADLTMRDVAALHVAGGNTVTMNGDEVSFSANEMAEIEERISDVVVTHMNDEANMGRFVVYDPENEPGVGRCATCHMPQTGKSGGYTTGLDEFGNTAMVEGDESSHRFDIIAPQLSASMVAGAGGNDLKVMPNSCGKCHARYRYSAD